MKLALMSLLIATAAIAEPSLVGLWVAKRHFGPDVRGTLTIVGDRATIAGRSAPVKIDQATVTFTLPGDEGSFRGLIRSDEIVGHWIQPAGVSTGSEFATPVTLRKTLFGQWRGLVTPIDDHMTIYLPIQKTDDGTLTTFVRNPERNIGIFFRGERVVLDGTRIKLLGADGSARAEGIHDPDNETMSIPFRGGTYDFKRATGADETAFYPRGKNAEPYLYRKPIADDDGWPVAAVEDVGISRDAITRFINLLITTPMDSLHASDIHGVLIARHGKLVVEEYFHGTSPEEPHDTRSAAKSLTSVLVGAAIRHGAPVSVSTPVYEAMKRDDVDPNKRAMTLEHLLTMSSGLDCDDADPKSPGNEDTMQEQTVQTDWYRFALDLKTTRRPGQKAVYCSSSPNLAGGVLARTTGRWLPDLYRELIATPLQIRHYGLNLTPTREAYMGGGARLRPRDFMKLGQLLMDGGRWKGRQVVSREWAARSISPLYEMRERRYGYLWWVVEYPYKERKVRAFFAGGNGGQIVMGVPELDLVIAFYGGNYSDRVLFVPQNVYVPEYILPAVSDGRVNFTVS